MKQIPALADINAGLISALEAQFDITIPDTEDTKNFLLGMVGAWASEFKSLYLYQGSIQRNACWVTADPVDQGGTLELWGQEILDRPPYPATQGQYKVMITGTSGATIDAGTQFTSDPTSKSPGYLFQLDSGFTLSGSSGLIILRALTAGTISNLAISDTLTCVIPLVNINQQCAVTAITVNSLDAETIEAYRAEISLHFQLAPQGGAVPDYVLWGSDAAGVAKIYPYTASGAVWEVDVYVEAVAADSTDGFGTPGSTILTNVTADIITDPVTGLARKPMGVVLGPSNVGALPVTIYQLTIEFTGSGTINSDQQTLITNALIGAVNNIRPFIGGSDNVANQNDTISVSLPSTGGSVAPPENYVIVVIAMQAVPGVVFTGVNLTVNGISQTSYQFDNGIIPFLQPSNVTFS